MSSLSERAWNADRDELLTMAQRIQKASQAIRQRRLEGAVAAERAAVDEFHAAVWEMYSRDSAYFDDRIDEVRRGESAAVERAVTFLEVDPICYHAGYTKERLLRALKATPRFSPDHTRRLRSALFAAVDRDFLRELQEWSKLAPRLGVNDVIAGLKQRVESDDPDLRRRGEWVLWRINDFITAHAALATAGIVSNTRG